MSELHNYDDIDVPNALGRKTSDGKGFEDEADLPPSDLEDEENDK